MKKGPRFPRSFHFLILGQVTSLLGNFTLKFALAMYVLEETGSAAVFGGMLSLSVVPTILLSPFGGILADRVDRRLIMVALDAFSGLAVLTAALLLPLGSGIPVVTALLVALSVLGAFESPTVQAAVPQILSGDALLVGNAAVSQVTAVTSLVTPFLGSLLYMTLGIGPVLLGTAACFFLTACFECFIRLKPLEPGPSAGILAVIREDLSAGVYFLRREQPDILKLLLLAALVNFFISGTAAVGFPYLVRTVLALPPSYYGAAESLTGGAAILGAVWAGTLGRRLPLGRLVLVFDLFGACLLVIGGAFLLPVGTLGRYGVLVAMFFLCQLGCSLFSTCAVTVIQGRTPGNLMGKIMSCAYTLSLCAQPLGQALYGGLFDRSSGCVSRVLIPSGCALCAIGVLSAGFFRRLEAEERKPSAR